MSAIATTSVTLERRNTFSIGLLIALSSWAIIFFTLVWGYVVYRLRLPTWLGEYLTGQIKFIAVVNTIAMALSSWHLSIGLKANSENNRRWAWSAFALGIVFLVGQFYLWSSIMGHGLHWQNSIAGGFFFLLTGFHALHIVGGLVALLVLCLKFNQMQSTLTSKGIKYFWDFLLVVWLVLFALIFIIQ